MKVYLDTSVILRRLWEEPDGIDDWGEWEESYTSELTRVELSRAVDRLRLQGRLDDLDVSKTMRLVREALEATKILAVDSFLLDRASRSFPVVVRTLDAIHLASAVLYREEMDEPLVFLTHDAQLGIAAQALGFEARGFKSAR